MLLRSKLVF